MISDTGPHARSSERRHEQRLFGQLSEIAVVVQSLIDFLQVLVFALHGHIEFRTTTVTDCIRLSAHFGSHTVFDELVGRRRADRSTHADVLRSLSVYSAR